MKKPDSVNAETLQALKSQVTETTVFTNFREVALLVIENTRIASEAVERVGELLVSVAKEEDVGGELIESVATLHEELISLCDYFTAVVTCPSNAKGVPTIETDDSVNH